MRPSERRPHYWNREACLIAQTWGVSICPSVTYLVWILLNLRNYPKDEEILDAGSNPNTTVRFLIRDSRYMLRLFIFLLARSLAEASMDIYAGPWIHQRKRCKFLFAVISNPLWSGPRSTNASDSPFCLKGRMDGIFTVCSSTHYLLYGLCNW